MMTAAAISMIPIFMMIFYLAIIGFIIWFAVSFINIQKERNLIFKEISSKLDNIEISKKRE